MATGKVIDGHPYAENPHVRFDDRDVALGMSLHGVLFRQMRLLFITLVIGACAFLPNVATAYTESVGGITWNYYFNFDNEVCLGDPAAAQDIAGAIEIPSSLGGYPVKVIGHTYMWNALPNGFSCCTNITSVTIPSSVREIAGCAFYECSRLSSVDIPSSVTCIGEQAFMKSGLTSVTIPASVTSFGDGAFRESPNLTSVTIEGNGETYIGDAAFYSCSALKSVTIGNGVSRIGRSAFNGCSSLTVVTIPASVTRIWDFAFENCSNLTTINFDGVPPIESCWFPSCTGTYRAEYAAEWEAEIDSEGYWCGLKMRKVTAEGGGSGEGGVNSGGDGTGGGSSGGTADLEPYAPSGWSAPLAFSTGYYSDLPESTTFTTANGVYAKITFHNSYTDVTTTFRVAIYVDGVFKYSRDVNGLKSGYYISVTGISLGSFSEGTHTVTLVVDGGDVVRESNEGNNTYTRTFTVSDPAQYTISLYRNAKPNDLEESWSHVGIGENYSLPTVAKLMWSRQGDTFLGWATSETAKTAQYADGQSVYNLSTKKGDIVNLYGVWQNRVSSTYSIRFDANGGTGGETRHLAYGETLGTLPSVVREGYKFDGWYTSPSEYKRIGTSTVVTADATYYAHWVKLESGDLVGTYVADKRKTMMGAVYNYSNLAGIIVIKAGKSNKKGVFRVSGTLTTVDGKKHALRATAAMQTEGIVTIKDIKVKNYGTLTLNLAQNGFSGKMSNGWSVRTANVSSLQKGTLKFDFSPYPTKIKGAPVQTNWLPRGITATSDGTKIVFPAAGRVALKNGSPTIIGDTGNPSGLKLKFAPRTGLLKGSFAVYTFDGKRLKKKNAKVTGVYADGKGRMIVKITGARFSADMMATLN